MALATRCPHCHTTFRVAADQLKLRGGIVRCGTCHEVFDGNAALIDLDAPPPPRPPALPAFLEPEPAFDVLPASLPPLEYGNGPPAPPLHRAPARPELAREVPVAEAPEVPVAEVREDEIGPEPEPIPEPIPEPTPEPIPEPAPEPEPEPEPILAPPPVHLPVDDALVAAPLPEEEPPAVVPVPVAPAATEPHSILRMPSSPPRQSAGIAYSPDAAMQARISGRKGKRKAGPAPAAKPVARARPVDPDEPAFVKLGRAKEERNPTRMRLMAAGCVLLAVLLLTQLFMASRDTLVARYPGLHPLASSICAAFGCRVALPTQIDTLAVETGELQTLGNGAFTYTTLLRNQGTLVQAWPSLELTLIDPNDKPLVRRVFAPREYLSSGTAAGGFAGRSEQTVKLSFQLADLKPSGYHIAIFYP